MEFRPCIDIHNGKVKQIVGGNRKGFGYVLAELDTAEKPGLIFHDEHIISIREIK